MKKQRLYQYITLFIVFNPAHSPHKEKALMSSFPLPLQDTRGGYDAHPVRCPPRYALAPRAHRMRQEMLTEQEKEKRTQAPRFEPPLETLWVRSGGVEAVCCADRRRHPGYGDRAVAR